MARVGKPSPLPRALLQPFGVQCEKFHELNTPARQALQDGALGCFRVGSTKSTAPAAAA